MDDTLYFFVSKHIYTVDSYWCIVGFLNSPLHRNGVDTSITLDAARWNCAGGELSSCVVHTIPLDHVLYYLEQIDQLTFNPFLFYVLIYMFMFLMYCDLHAQFSFSTYIYSIQLCNMTNSFNM